MARRKWGRCCDWCILNNRENSLSRPPPIPSRAIHLKPMVDRRDGRSLSPAACGLWLALTLPRKSMRSLIKPLSSSFSMTPLPSCAGCCRCCSGGIVWGGQVGEANRYRFEWSGNWLSLVCLFLSFSCESRATLERR